MTALLGTIDFVFTFFGLFLGETVTIFGRVNTYIVAVGPNTSVRVAGIGIGIAAAAACLLSFSFSRRVKQLCIATSPSTWYAQS